MSNYIYERHLCNDPDIVIPLGEESGCFAIEFKSIGYLCKVVVIQNSGTPVDFTVDVFNKDVCGNSSSSNGGCNEELARILPQLSATAGNAAVEFSIGGYAFRNMDLNQQSGLTRQIYVRITPANADDETGWDIALTCAGFQP